MSYINCMFNIIINCQTIFQRNIVPLSRHDWFIFLPSLEQLISSFFFYFSCSDRLIVISHCNSICTSLVIGDGEVLLPGKSHRRQRSLVGCSPWVAKSRRRLSDFIFTFHFHALEKEMATHSSVLAWRIPGTGEPGGLPSMGSHRIGHDWSELATAAATIGDREHNFMYYCICVFSSVNIQTFFSMIVTESSIVLPFKSMVHFELIFFKVWVLFLLFCLEKSSCNQARLILTPCWVCFFDFNPCFYSFVIVIIPNSLPQRIPPPLPDPLVTSASASAKSLQSVGLCSTP